MPVLSGKHKFRSNVVTTRLGSIRGATKPRAKPIDTYSPAPAPSRESKPKVSSHDIRGLVSEALRSQNRGAGVRGLGVSEFATKTA
jgi:hypothetical protein